MFDVAQLERFLETSQHVHIPIIAGIWPLVSVRNAEFLANEVPGVTVPVGVIERMRRANERSKEHAVAEGIAIAREMLERVRGSVQGVQVSAPFGKVELALQVIGGPGSGLSEVRDRGSGNGIRNYTGRTMRMDGRVGATRASPFWHQPPCTERATRCTPTVRIAHVVRGVTSKGRRMRRPYRQAFRRR